jgi:hypothetical protein
LVIYESGIPFIGLSSGSVDANGVISAITALPIAYAHAYCWFPANALATSIAAGWHYCTFSTTTAGVAYLDTYTSGNPSIPASPTAVMDGKGAFTGVTAEVFGPTITIGANATGTNGGISFAYVNRFTNSGNAKTTALRYSGTSGTLLINLSLTSQLGVSGHGRIWNRGVANVQTSTQVSVDQANAVRSAAPVAAAIDTTAATTLVFSSTRATATDNYIYDAVSVGIRRGV